MIDVHSTLLQSPADEQLVAGATFGSALNGPRWGDIPGSAPLGFKTLLREAGWCQPCLPPRSTGTKIFPSSR